MSAFGKLLDQLLTDPSGKKLLINHKEHIIRAMIRLTSKNYQGNEYIKIYFEDGSFLLLLLNEKEVYYTNEPVGEITEISDEMIGLSELRYQDKTYQLVNNNDYQFVLQLYAGKPWEIEGECRFSDYMPLDGSKEILSLGWLSYNNKRADLNPKMIDLENIEVVR